VTLKSWKSRPAAPMIRTLCGIVLTFPFCYRPPFGGGSESSFDVDQTSTFCISIWDASGVSFSVSTT
jgi:hypothetical protein